MTGEYVTVAEALGQFLTRYVAAYAPRVEFDPEWPSPCVTGEPDEEGEAGWQPMAQTDALPFGDIDIHPDTLEFYGSWWAGPVEARWENESVLLNTLWNKQEKESMLHNLREHSDGQRQAGMPRQTVPVAGTDSDFYFSVDNETGAVWLEEPGYSPLREVAPSLAAFLKSLTLSASPPLQ